MDFSRATLIGFPELPSIRSDTLFSSYNINENLLIAWHMASIGTDLAKFNITISSRAVLGTKTVDALETALKSRMQEILAWVSDGHTFVIVPSQIPTVLKSAPGGYTEVDLMPVLTFGMFGLEPINGNLVVSADGPSKEITDRIAPRLRYDYSVNAPTGIPLFKSSSTLNQRSTTLGVAIKVGNGVVIVAPPAKIWKAEVEYFEKLSLVLASLKSSPGSVPDWTIRFKSAPEKAAADSAAALNAQIEKIAVEVDKHQRLVAGQQHAKFLYAGTGDNFARAVQSALETFGLTVAPGPRLRGDLLIWDGKKLAVAEVKGLDGTAKEQNLRQAERWLADVRSTLSAEPAEREKDPDLAEYARILKAMGVPLDEPDAPTDCHGIMIIGTFRKLELPNRTEDSFNDPLRKTIARSEIGVISGLDLYCLTQEAKQAPKRGSEIAKMIMDQKGVLPAPAWTTIITFNQ